MVTSKKQRITLGTFDFIKGVAMICIVLLHTLNTYNVEESFVLSGLSQTMDLVRSGIIPLFFLISGFGFKPKDTNVMLKKTFTDMVIPYLWIVAAFALVYPVVLILTMCPVEQTIKQTLCYVISLLLGNTGYITLFDMMMPWWLPCWYLLASFVSFNILNQILRINKIGYQIVAVLLCVAAGYGLFCLNFHYYCIPQGMMGVGYCYGGYMLKKRGLLEKLMANVWSFVILVPISVAEALWGFFDLCPGVFNNVILDYIGAGGMGLLLLLVGVCLGQMEWKILEGIKSVGIYTYWIICIHSFEENGLPWHLWQQAMTEHQLLGFILEIFARLLLITAVCVILKKISKYRYKRKMVKNAK